MYKQLFILQNRAVMCLADLKQTSVKKLLSLKILTLSSLYTQQVNSYVQEKDTYGTRTSSDH